MSRAILLLILASTTLAQQFEPRGRTSPDTQLRMHSLCLITRGIQTLAAACRIEDARRPGFENFYRIEVMSPFMRLDIPERYETAVTVRSKADGNMQVVIEGWGQILMIPIDSEMRDAQRLASQHANGGLETIRQGVTILAVGDGQYTIVFDHVGRGW